MTIHNLIRVAILRTNPYWPFSQINGLPYFLALRIFTQVCKRFPQIISVYLRHPLIKGSWIPGLSDLDLTIVIKSQLKAQQEFSFLCAFWQSVSNLKRLFPMIGEIEILDEQNINFWTQFGLEGYLSKKWQLLYGKDVKNDLRTSSQRFKTESIRYAFWFYVKHVLDEFYSSNSSTYLILSKMKRLMRKVQQCSSFARIPNIHNPQSELSDNKADVLFAIIKTLEKSIIDHLSSKQNNKRKQIELKTGIQSSRKDNLDSNIQNTLLDLKAIGHSNELISCVLVNRQGKIFILLKVGLKSEAMEKCLAAIECLFIKKKNKPVILTFKLFWYMICFYDPYEYLNLLRYRKVIYGHDPLANMSFPDEDAFIHCWINQIPTLLLVPRSSESFFIAKMDCQWRRQIASFMRRSLILKLYLENGIIKHTYDEIFDDLRKCYPEKFEELTVLEKMSGEAVEETDRLKWFGLLRGLMCDIHMQLSAQDTVDKAFSVKKFSHIN